MLWNGDHQLSIHNPGTQAVAAKAIACVPSFFPHVADYSIDVELNPALNVTEFNRILDAMKQSLGKLGDGIKPIDSKAFGFQAAADDSSKVAKGVKGIGDEAERQQSRVSAFGKAFQFNQINAAVGQLASTLATLQQPLVELDTNVKNIGTLGVEGFEEYSKLALDLSKKVPDSAATIANGVYNAISAGVTGSKQDIISFTESAAKAAVAGISDTNTAVNAGTSVLNAYKLTAKDSGKVFDTFFAGIKLGKTSFAEMSAGLANVIPAASAAGIKFDEVTAAISQMTALGVPTAQSTTQIRAAIIELQKPGKDLEVVLAKAGLSAANMGKQLREQGLIATLQQVEGAAKSMGKSMTQVFSSSEAASAALLVTGENAARATQTLEQVRAEVDAGAATQAYDVAAQGIEVRTKIFLNRVKAVFAGAFQAIGSAGNVAISAASQLAPIVASLAGLGQIIPDSAVKGVVGFAKSLLVTLVPSLATSAGFAGTTALSFRGMWAAVTGPVGLVIAAIVAVGAAVYLLYQNSETFRVAIDSAWTTVKAFASSLYESIAPAIETTWQVLKAIGSVILDVIVFQLKVLWAEIQIVANVLIAVLTPVVTTVYSLLQSVGSWLDSTFTPIWESLAGVYEQIAAFISNEFIPAFADAGDLLDEIGSFVGDIFTTYFETLWDVLSGLAEFVYNILVKAWEAQWSVIVTVYEAIITAIEWVANLVSGLLGLGNVTTSTTSIMSSFRSIVTGVKAAIDFLRAGVAGLSAVFTVIVNTIGDVIDALSNLDFGEALDKITGFFGAAQEAGSKGFADKEQQIKDQRALNDAVDKLIQIKEGELKDVKDLAEKQLQNEKLTAAERVKIAQQANAKLDELRKQANTAVFDVGNFQVDKGTITREESNDLIKAAYKRFDVYRLAVEQQSVEPPKLKATAGSATAAKAAAAKAVLDFTDEYKKLITANQESITAISIKGIVDQREQERRESKDRIDARIRQSQEEFEKLQKQVEANAKEKAPKPIKLQVFEVDAAGQLVQTEKVITSGTEALKILGEQYDERQKLIRQQEELALRQKFASEDLKDLQQGEISRTRFLSQASETRIAILQRESALSAAAFDSLQVEQAAKFQREQSNALRDLVESTQEFAKGRASIEAEVKVGKVDPAVALDQIDNLRDDITSRLTVGVNIDPAAAEAYTALLQRFGFEQSEFDQRQLDDATRRHLSANVNLAERERDLTIQSARETWRERLRVAAGNEALEAQAFTDFMQSKVAAEQNYLVQSKSLQDSFLATSQSFSAKLSQAFADALNPPIDDEAQKKLRDSLKAEEDAVFASLQARTIGYEEYAKKIDAINQKRQQLAVKEIGFWEPIKAAAAVAFDEIGEKRQVQLGKSIDTLSAKFSKVADQVKQSGSLAGVSWSEFGEEMKSVAVDATGVALASFGSLVAQGVPLLKAFGIAAVSTVVDTVQSIITANIPAIFSTAIAMLGPLAGSVAAVSAIGLVSGLLQLAKAKLPKHHTGLDVSPDEHLAVILKREAVVNPLGTQRFQHEIRMMNRGVSREELRQHFIQEGRSTTISGGDLDRHAARLERQLQKVVKLQKRMNREYSSRHAVDVRIKLDKDAMLRAVQTERYANLNE